MTVKNKGWTQAIEASCSSISLPHIDRLGSASVFFGGGALIIYFWLHWFFNASPVVVWGLLNAMGSLVAVRGSRCAGFSNCGIQAQKLRHTGPSCAKAHGILLDQGRNTCLLHWQTDSQPLDHWEVFSSGFNSGQIKAPGDFTSQERTWVGLLTIQIILLKSEAHLSLPWTWIPSEVICRTHWN